MAVGQQRVQPAPSGVQALLLDGGEQLHRRVFGEFAADLCEGLGGGLPVQLVRLRQQHMHRALDFAAPVEHLPVEIAELTQVPRETVKSRLRYALSRLRKALAEADEAPASATITPLQRPAGETT